VWQVIFHPDAEAELSELPLRERAAMVNAVEKLIALGPTLPFPHQSDVRGVEDVRELRPRAGRSAWRAFYRRIGNVFVVGALGPEAESDERGFNRAVMQAMVRLHDIEL
jgi:hypothetical protein